MSQADSQLGDDPEARGPLERGDEVAIVAGIRAAERDNRGEVRVHVEARCPGDALERATELYEFFEVGGTAEDTGVLLYVAYEDHKAAVFAGEGVHGGGHTGFWQSVVDTVTSGYANQKGIDGILAALKQVGELLRRVVPGDDIHGNELPDAVTSG